jgi:hypothetical protein
VGVVDVDGSLYMSVSEETLPLPPLVRFGDRKDGESMFIRMGAV